MLKKIMVLVISNFPKLEQKFNFCSLLKSKDTYMKKQIKYFIITFATMIITVSCQNNEILDNSEKKPSKLDKFMNTYVVLRTAQLNGDIPFRQSCNSTQFNICRNDFEIDKAIQDSPCPNGYVYQTNPCTQENSVGVCITKTNKNIYIVGETVYYSPQYNKETANQACANSSFPELIKQFNEQYTARYSYPPNK